VERFLFNATTESFLKVVYSHLLTILETETDLKILRKRIKLKNLSVPFQLVVFEGKKLGYFCATTSRIAINKALLYQATTHTLKNIIRHELAHLIAYYEFRDRTPHGAAFHEVCKRYNWDREVSLATVNLDEANREHIGDLQAERLINKISKLLSLSKSDNKNEASLAMIRANELMLAHNLTHLNTACSSNEELEETYIIQLCEGAKVTEKIRAISQILSHYMVYPVFNHGRGSYILEITGTKENTELGEYLYHYLDRQFDHLWKVAQINDELKGMREKNSFMRALSHSILNNLKTSEKMNSKGSTNGKKEMTTLNNQLMLHVQRAYTNLTTTRSQAGIDRSAFEAGSRAGKDFSINLPLSHTKDERRLLK